MPDLADFVVQSKSILIAPAGYGKTYTIAECLKHTPDNEKQLILTHTNAGIASIKEKIKKLEIPGSKYHVETITGFAQKYVLAFYVGNNIPSQENSKEYYSFIIEKATKLLKYTAIQRVVSETYNGLFVDEYQDCTKIQHELIIVLSNLFKTRILGDHMQGIFGFNEPLIKLDDQDTFSDFKKYELDTPWRWIKGENPDLGNDLKKIREELETNNSINFDLYNSITSYTYNELDLFNPAKQYNRVVRSLLDEDSLLIIHPISNNINPRVKVNQTFNNRLCLVESIDDKDFYKLSKLADELTIEDIFLKLIKLCYMLFNKTGLDNWLNNNGFKNKSKVKDKAKTVHILRKFEPLNTSISFITISEIIGDISNLTKVKCCRRELLNSFRSALYEAEFNNISVTAAMENKRNSIRRIGKKISGRCIGTTLLTKGLEFDTVAILNAHKFESPKHLYVALTRATNKLIVFTKDKELNFN